MAYTASLSTTPGRPGFSVSFRHPCRLDSKGKPGLKMRRGLGTDDPAKAEILVAQMNQLLQEEIWWTAAKHRDALEAFDSRIVDAFYDSIQAGTTDSYEMGVCCTGGCRRWCPRRRRRSVPWRRPAWAG